MVMCLHCARINICVILNGKNKNLWNEWKYTTNDNINYNNNSQQLYHSTEWIKKPSIAKMKRHIRDKNEITREKVYTTVALCSVYNRNIYTCWKYCYQFHEEEKIIS